MGCENSQLVEPAPHEPHHLPPEEESPDVPVASANVPPKSSNKDIEDAKENSRPV